MSENKSPDNSNVTSSVIANILVSGVFILLLVITSNYQSLAFWLGTIGEFILAYLTLKLSKRWGILRYLFIAIAILLPSALDTALNIPHELRPNIAFGIYLLIIVWLPPIMKLQQARALSQGSKNA